MWEGLLQQLVLEAAYCIPSWDLYHVLQLCVPIMTGAAYTAEDAGKPLLAHFLEGLLRRLLLEAVGRDAVEAAADPLLALILAEPAAFQSLGALWAEVRAKTGPAMKDMLGRRRPLLALILAEPRRLPIPGSFGQGLSGWVRLSCCSFLIRS